MDHRGVGLVTGEVGAGKSTAIRTILGALNPNLYSLWFASSDQPPPSAEPRRKVEPGDVQKALASIGSAAGYNDLRYRVMTLTTCSKRTAQIAITRACDEKCILREDGRYRLPVPADLPRGRARSKTCLRVYAGPGADATI